MMKRMSKITKVQVEYTLKIDENKEFTNAATTKPSPTISNILHAPIKKIDIYMNFVIT